MRRTTALAGFALLLFLAPTTSRAGADVDGDGLDDAAEDANSNGIWDVGETNALDADTDGGGEADGSEIRAGRNPLRHDDDFTFDRDGDGLTNAQESALGTNPDSKDTDGDGIADHRDAMPTVPLVGQDADQDGLPDSWEVAHGQSPRNVADASGDPDGDGRTTAQEFVGNTNPQVADTPMSASGAAITEGTPVNPCLRYDPEQAAPFPDMDGHWARTTAAVLARLSVLPIQMPIVRGYPPPSGRRDRAVFLPDRPVSRYELLKMGLFSSCLDPLPSALLPPQSFTDLPATTEDETGDATLKRRIIGTAAFLEIVEGYNDGTFRPDAPVNRAEALKILLEFASLPLPDSAPTIAFTDVSEGDWFAPYLAEGLGHGVIRGFDDGTFRPGAPITRAEAAKIALLLLLKNPGVNGSVVPESLQIGLSQ
ncbi:MAG: peptidase C1A papain [Candidatus Peregrinibacteria bacterium Gr01-1014_25]|nr:MAG: peptidase C1A papain [Candidatus Peregrinibacteria bacterium Gr01-1014_25]